jgi:lipid-A-disaccharide synthase
MTAPLRLFLVAGETSADTLGARLVRALRQRAGRPLELTGIGGQLLAAEGLESRFPMEELSLMGLVEVLPHIPRVLRRLRETRAFVHATRPDAVVTIDAPGFNLRLLRRIGPGPWKRIQYVAPQAWAWRQGRARKLPGLVDRLLLLLPFEEPFFAGYGVPVTFVGHPIVEELPARVDPQGFRAAHGLADAHPLLVLLPGSRRSEVARHLPVLERFVALLAARRPTARIVLPTVPAVVEQVRAATGAWAVPVTVLTDRARRFDAYAAADLAIAASGTVTLELALAGVPSLVIYRISPLTGFVARRMIKVPYASLVNLIGAEEIIPELIQENCTPERLLAAATRLLDDDATADRQRRRLAEVAAALAPGEGLLPSERAADAVLQTLGG